MRQSIEVRPAGAGDADQVWPLVRAFATSTRPDEAAFRRSFTELIGRDDTLVLVAADESGRRVVGYLLASTHGTLFANGPVAWVEEVMVAEDVRRAGVGQALMAAAQRWAADRSATYVSLATRRADSFYLALGYTDSARFYKRDLDPDG